MEIKLPGTEDREQQYFDDLLAKIRDIRSSERMPRQKITDLIRTAKDFDDTDPTGCLSAAVNKMSRLDDNGLLRMFNSLFLFAESMTKEHYAMKVKEACDHIIREVNNVATNTDIYTFDCYSAEYDYDEEGNATSAHLPKELEGFKGGSMILKIEDMDRFVDTFSSRSTYYRRAFSILAELDGRVLESLECNQFETWELVSYKEDGDAMFEFSHFEVNTNEPDNDYRTLYVVYRYDTTIS